MTNYLNWLQVWNPFGSCIGCVLFITRGIYIELNVRIIVFKLLRNLDITPPILIDALNVSAGGIMYPARMTMVVFY